MLHYAFLCNESQADNVFQSNTVGSCQVFGDPCFSGKVNNIYSCSSSDKVTPLFPSCPLCTSGGNVWVTAVPNNTTLFRPDLGQCFFSNSTDMPLTCPDCTNIDKWRHIMRPSDCFSGQLSFVPSLFSNPSTTCLQVRQGPKHHTVLN
jgi:hypothetical protein